MLRIDTDERKIGLTLVRGEMPPTPPTAQGPARRRPRDPGGGRAFRGAASA